MKVALGVFFAALAGLVPATARAQDGDAPPKGAIQPVQVELPLMEVPSPDVPYANAYLAQDILRVATMAGFAASNLLGQIAMINKPTLFGDGACADDGEGVGGAWGCDGMSALHGTMGISTALLYLAEQITGFAIPGDEPDYGTVHRVATYVHIGGIITTPLIGVLAAQPGIFGEEEDVDAEWPRTGRTLHMISGMITAGAYWTATMIELTRGRPPAPAQTARRGRASR